MSEFAIGQRWLSETEIELGLGVVTGINGRQVSIMFPANGEIRAYASHNAPLTRFRLDQEDTGTHSDGWTFSVQDHDDVDGLIVYAGTRDGEAVQVPETQLHYQVQLSSPLNRLLAGQLDRVNHYNLRQQAGNAMRHWLDHPARGLLGARIDVLPHQMYVAHSVGQRVKPRVLLADEVGLGKTIEAGLILQTQLLNALAQRVLIRVPDPLLHQWMIELRRRFNLAFSIIDESFCEAAAESGQNPFEQVQLALCPASLLDDEDVQMQALACDWDMVVVDEAHQLSAEQRDLIGDLAEGCGLLLLTATPDQGGADTHFAQLNLLDPERFHDLAAFRAEQQQYQQVATEAAGLAADSDALNTLLDEHGTGRVLLRNTRANVSGFPTRQYHPHELEHDALSGESELDVKVAWLHAFARQHGGDKMLVMMQTQTQVEEVAASLRVKFGRHCALFHEGMTLIERDRAAAFFADQEDGAQLLLSSEIGGEGRNFQFARHVIMLDLPEHPDKLEQRIGRLDRIGQLDTFDIHVPMVAGSLDARLATWYHQGMQAFTQANATGHALLLSLGRKLKKGLQGSEDEFAALVEQTAAQVATIREHMGAGRDRLLELNSCRLSVAKPLCDAVLASDQSTELATFMFSFWDQFGVDVEDKDDQRLIIKPGQNFAANGLPGMDEEGSLVTFDRRTALHYDDVQFLTWEHPQVLTALELVMTEQHGSTTVAILKNKALPAGHWFVEMNVRASLPSAPTLGLEKLYPTPTLRILSDAQGRNLSAKISADTLNKQLHFVNKKTGAQMVKALRQPLQQVVKSQMDEAQTLLLASCQQAATKRLTQIDQDIQRLQSLKMRNPSIRQDEIDSLQALRQQWHDAYAAPQVSLDSLRLIINAGADS
ncbi:helicase-related protein [Aliidiomarina maris]|uniref:RNA polymerase-associated protein RapA n=1 Tax=Aliidiomarina maris TaxID=531312 RepID=A0A327WS14_9GAMM|nr:helicase-related protein [Aliidiomarina maris]RAJ94943.1 ATP-dependent helicase HepA [Aliidiomarina maris]RUO22153.1 RNA polymerase-associated protein RapA [Aliidiomarina maris]